MVIHIRFNCLAFLFIFANITNVEANLYYDKGVKTMHDLLRRGYYQTCQYNKTSANIIATSNQNRRYNESTVE